MSGASGGTSKEPEASVDEVLGTLGRSADKPRLAPLENAANRLAWAVFFLVVMVVVAALVDFGCSAATSRTLITTIATQPASTQPNEALKLHQELGTARRTALFKFVLEALLPVFTLLLGYLFGTGTRKRESK